MAGERYVEFPRDFDFIATRIYEGEREDAVLGRLITLKGLDCISQKAIDFFLEMVKNRSGGMMEK